MGTNVTDERVKEAFEADLEAVLKLVYGWSRDYYTWPSEVKGIIANLMFNLGRYRLNKLADLRAELLARNLTAAAEELTDIKWPKHVQDRISRLIDRMRNIVVESDDQGNKEKQTQSNDTFKKNTIQ